jgi:hypothetical protein
LDDNENKELIPAADSISPIPLDEFTALMKTAGIDPDVAYRQTQQLQDMASSALQSGASEIKLNAIQTGNVSGNVNSFTHVENKTIIYMPTDLIQELRSASIPRPRLQQQNEELLAQYPGMLTMVQMFANVLDQVAHPQVVQRNNTAAIQQPTVMQQPWPADLDFRYYNLIVLYGETFEGKTFKVPTDRALTEFSTPEELRSEYNSFSLDARAKLRRYPCLFMAETEYPDRYHADQNQIAYYGFIDGILPQYKEIEVSFRKCCSIPQYKLDEMLFDLGAVGAPRCSELRRTHWALKPINLVEVLRKAGFTIPYPPVV